MRVIPLCLAVVVCLALAGPATAAITNGGFETGDFTGWTQFGDTSFSGVGSGFQHSGTFAAAFGNLGPGGIFQDVPTIAGNPYELRFWLQLEGTDPNSFEATWNGVTLMTLVDSAPFPYTEFVFTVTGAPFATDTELRFTFTNPPSFWDLDDVSISDLNAVPEPTSLAIWSLSALGAGVFYRRGRRLAAG